MANAALERILREHGGDLLAVLAERLNPTDLQSLLLEVYRLRAARQAPAELLAAYERNPYVRASPADPRALLELDRRAFAVAAPTFAPVELAPVCPLGTSSAVATVDQNKALATIRTTEVVSDSTNVLALECAVRRRALLRTKGQEHQRVQLCASHRLLRPQRFSGPAAFAHFRLFGMCSAGRDEGSFRFECDTLRAHLRVYLRLLAELAAGGHRLGPVRVGLTPLGGVPEALLVASVLEPLAAEFPEALLALDHERASGRGYYTGLCFALYLGDVAEPSMIADGGLTSWTQQLLSNRKERLLISGLGTERLCALFGGA